MYNINFLRFFGVGFKMTKILCRVYDLSEGGGPSAPPTDEGFYLFFSSDNSELGRVPMLVKVRTLYYINSRGDYIAFTNYTAAHPEGGQRVIDEPEFGFWVKITVSYEFI